MYWPDEVDEIIGGDQVVMLATVTPRQGVILTPLTNFGVRDRAAGTLQAVNSSVGMWQKLQRVRREPRVALAFHTRAHGDCDRPEFVLVQGVATVTPLEDRGYVESLGDAWERFAGPPPRGPLWRWWLRAWHWRAGIEIRVERVTVWPDLACGGEPAVYGAAAPGAPPAPQPPPAGGTAPRVDHVRAATRAQRLPHVVLGWVGADELPVIAPVGVVRADAGGIVLTAPAGRIPQGGRRAGLAAHWFARYTVGQDQRLHTGWLEVDGERILYAPHTERGYRFPRSWFVYRLAAGLFTRLGLRQARRAGLLPAGR